MHEMFGHMELSGLAVVTDKSLMMERLPHPPWEDISPCKDVEGMFFLCSIPRVFDKYSLQKRTRNSLKKWKSA